MGIGTILLFIWPIIFGIMLYRKNHFNAYQKRVKNAVNDVSHYMRKLAEGDPDKELAWIRHDGWMRANLMRADLDEMEISFMFWRSYSSVYNAEFLEKLWAAYEKIPVKERRFP